ncbi:GNAT family N-acetyltransferase [Chryseobacterium aahli]|uniref:GNAT family N-acetyltransferase n=1 Tax=Chryseobacterium aahli TaxID=1278643 RepID=UPI001F61C197|nr:GNAT family N-acetyltransferase [Chryseobacterium aahli]MCI3937184.1 GNAT family N-acetyltransferase [Chryseobacterium aahli]
MIIEQYTDKYKNEVVKLIVDIQRQEFGVDLTVENQPDLQKIPTYYQIGNGNFWIAKNENGVIGTISLLDIGNNQGALRKMFVAKNYRGKDFGIGQKLLETLIFWANEKGIKEIFLGTTAQFIGAQKFYEKNGFVELNKNDLPKNFPIVPVDVKFYKK